MSTEVNFTSNGLRIAGLFFTPEGQLLPAIVIGHPGGGVKEQTASTYAQRLADKGYARPTEPSPRLIDGDDDRCCNRIVCNCCAGLVQAQYVADQRDRSDRTDDPGTVRARRPPREILRRVRSSGNSST